jgi:hypothetical protein
MAGDNALQKVMDKAQDIYVNNSEKEPMIWFRSVLQSLDFELKADGGMSVSVGQALERFLFTKADLLAKERLDETISLINSRLSSAEIDLKRIEDEIEPLAKLFINFLSVVPKQEHEELRRAYAIQMANFFDATYSELDNQYFYQQLLFRLTIDHLYILQYAKKYLSEDPGTIHEQSKSLRKAIIDTFIARGLDEALIIGLIKDLDSMGLLNATQSALVGGDLHQLYLSALGRNLLEQIVI